MDVAVGPGDGERLEDIKEPEEDEGEETPSVVLRVKENGDKHPDELIDDDATVVMHTQSLLGLGTGNGSRHRKTDYKNKANPPRQIHEYGTHGQSSQRAAGTGSLGKET